MDRFALPFRKVAAGVLLAMAALAVSTQAADNADTLTAQGDEFDRQFQTAQALSVYQQALAMRPDSAELHRKIAKQYVEMVLDERNRSTQVKLAQSGYDSALKAKALAPRDAEVRLTVGVAAARLAFHTSNPRRKMELSRVARDEAEAAIKLQPGYALAWHMLGRWHYEMAGLNPLLRIVAEAIYGKLPEASYEQAVTHLNKAVTLEPGRPLFHAELGRAYLALGQNAQAKRELQKSLSLPRQTRDDAAAQDRARLALRSL
jgi:tetratricopeptide (TPR) repeat protein